MSARNGTNWQRIWRRGFAPVLSIAGLQALQRALETDDPCLVQGTTTHPAGVSRSANEPVCAACPLGYAGWRGEGMSTAGEVDGYFSRLCIAADERLGEMAATVDFLNWVDDTPRAAMRRQLLAEVDRTLAERLPAAA
jgi:hypothetical protein